MSDRDRRVAQPSLFDVPDTAPASEHQLSLPPEGGSHANAVADSEPRAADHGLRTTAGEQREQDSDADARAYAVDPRHNVVLEASAGTGKTSVLVARYVNLLKAGVDPANILAITFTRKAAAEMRERILRELRRAAERSELDRARWLDLRDRLGDIAISTIDAFCLSLLREFPLEADIDPAFELADETEVPRLIATSLDRTMRILVAIAREDRDVALVLAQLGIGRTRDGLATLARPPARRPGRARPLPRTRPATSEALQICRDAAAALGDDAAGDPWRPRRVPEGGTGRASTLLAVPARRPPAGEPERRARGGDSIGARAGQRALSDQRGQGAQGLEHLSLQPGPLPDERRDEAPSRCRLRCRAASRAGDVRVQPRSQRRARAGRAADVRRGARPVPPRARGAGRPRFLRRPREGAASCCGRWTSSRRAAIASNRAFTTSSSTSSRTPAGRSGSWCRCSSRPGAKGSASPRIRRSSSSAIGSSRFTASATPTSPCCSMPPSTFRGCDRRDAPRRSIARSFRAVPGLLHFVNDVFTEMSQPDARIERLHLRRPRSISRRGRHRRRGRRSRADPRRRRRRNARRVRRRRRRRNRGDPRRLGDRPRQGHRRRTRRPGPGTSASSSGPARRIASSSAS